MQRQTVKATYTYIYVTFQLPVAATAPDATSSQRPLEAATTVCSLRMRRRMLDFHLNEASAAVVHGGSSVVPRSLDVGAGDAGAVMARRVGGCSQRRRDSCSRRLPVPLQSSSDLSTSLSTRMWSITLSTTDFSSGAQTCRDVGDSDDDIAAPRTDDSDVDDFLLTPALSGDLSAGTFHVSRTCTRRSDEDFRRPATAQRSVTAGEHAVSR